ncbi:MAG: RsmE family RNA methyltransferase [Phycisphaeraceae bacterium]
MQRFLCDQLKGLAAGEGGQHLSDASVALSAEESHHAVRVLRLKAGDWVELLDGSGRVAEGTIEQAGRKVTVRVASMRTEQALKPRLDVAVAIPKGPRADAMVEQLSQLGVDRLIPLRTTRSIVDPRDNKLERFSRAAMESAKQCGRAHMMRVEPTADFGPSLLSLDHDLRLFASTADADDKSVDERLRETCRVLVLIGPEGGWTVDEADAAKNAGCVPWRLGPHVMRIETAAVAAAAIVRRITWTEAPR